MFYKNILYKNILQETKNSQLFDNHRIQDNVKCHIQHEESCNWTGKLQVTLFVAYIFPKSVLAHFQRLLGRSNRDVFWKMKAKHMKENVWKSFFLNFQVDIS